MRYILTFNTDKTGKQINQLLSALKGLSVIDTVNVQKINDSEPKLKTKEVDNSNVMQFSLTQTAEKIYSAYPRKQWKTKGIEKLNAYLNKGCEIVGMGKVRYNHHQIYMAVQQYANECTEQQKEQQFIKEFSTFMNKSVIDYVETTQQAYEIGMKSKYGEKWSGLRFEYK